MFLVFNMLTHVFVVSSLEGINHRIDDVSDILPRWLKRVLPVPSLVRTQQRSDPPLPLTIVLESDPSLYHRVFLGRSVIQNYFSVKTVAK